RGDRDVAVAGGVHDGAAWAHHVLPRAARRHAVVDRAAPSRQRGRPAQLERPHAKPDRRRAATADRRRGAGVGAAQERRSPQVRGARDLGAGERPENAQAGGASRPCAGAGARQGAREARRAGDGVGRQRLGIPGRARGARRQRAKKRAAWAARFACRKDAYFFFAVLRFAVFRLAVLRFAVFLAPFFAVLRFAVFRLAVFRFAVFLAAFFAVFRLAVLRFAVLRFAVFLAAFFAFFATLRFTAFLGAAFFALRALRFFGAGAEAVGAIIDIMSANIEVLLSELPELLSASGRRHSPFLPAPETAPALDKSNDTCWLHSSQISTICKISRVVVWARPAVVAYSHTRSARISALVRGDVLRHTRKSRLGRAEIVDALARKDFERARALDENLGGARARVVVGAQRHRIGARGGDREKVAVGERERALVREEIGALADRADDLPRLRCPVARMHRAHVVPRVVERRAHEVVHRRVDDGEAALAAAFQVFDAGDQDAGVRDQRAAGLEEQRVSSLADSTAHRRRIVGGRDRNLVAIAHADAAAQVDVRQRNARRLDPVGEVEHARRGLDERREVGDLRAGGSRCR